MDEEDSARLQEGIHLAQAGQKRMAYDQFCIIRHHGNADDTGVLFWIIFTTPYQKESAETIERLATLSPTHYKLPEARDYYNRQWNAPRRRSWLRRHPILTMVATAMTVVLAITLASSSKRHVLFTASHQMSTSFSSTIFHADGALEVTYSCQNNVGIGVNVQFVVGQVTNEGRVETVTWTRGVNCPDSGTTTFSVPPGTYQVGVASNGDTDWSMTVTQV